VLGGDVSTAAVISAVVAAFCEVFAAQPTNGTGQAEVCLRQAEIDGRAKTLRKT
jgi:hypothetical protein